MDRDLEEWFVASHESCNAGFRSVYEQYLKADSTFADIGANVGVSTDFALSIQPSLECHLFEPSERHCQYLRERFAANTNVKVHPVALGETSGEKTLFMNLHNNFGGTFVETLKHEGGVEQVVQMRPFSAYEPLMNSLSFVKMDAEGWEFSILRGMRSAIQRWRPGILRELVCGSERNKNFTKDIEEMRWLESIGYKFRRMAASVDFSPTSVAQIESSGYDGNAEIICDPP